jgi:hypothetical protein
MCMVWRDEMDEMIEVKKSRPFTDAEASPARALYLSLAAVVAYIGLLAFSIR